MGRRLMLFIAFCSCSITFKFSKALPASSRKGFFVCRELKSSAVAGVDADSILFLACVTNIYSLLGGVICCQPSGFFSIVES